MELKSEQRTRYHDEVSLVQQRFGSLEEIRHTLGFSQRKMAELLMVDPSAWTRWTKDLSEKAPPHVYRALGWYLELLELRGTKKAVQDVPNVAWTNSLDVEWQERFTDLQNRYEARLSEGLGKAEKVTLGWKLFLILNTTVVVYMIFFR